MKLSLAWLSEWVRLPGDEAAFAHALTMAGFEVEGRSPAAPAFSNVVVARIVSAEAHPQADKLRVCSVDAGDRHLLQIVCGAPNARAGILVPLARVGARLPGDVHIKNAKLRGVESFGMLCSARELGLGDSHSGLLELPETLALGADLRSALALDDTVLEINFTPNRGDALSVLGIAREAAVLCNSAVCVPPTPAVAAACEAQFPVHIEAAEGCARFAGRVIRGVNPAAKTPLWMQERLRRAGQRSLGPLVDVTNYVMLELGQPMHAYDLRRLSGSIHVRWARSGESLELLDGTAIALAPDMLVIADDVAPVGLAGVMGGEKSGIADDTTDVFLEAAWFAPNAVAGRGRRFGLITDASQRFERGVDPQGIERAMQRATQLLLDMAGGTPGPLVLTEAPEHRPVRSPIPLRSRQIERLLGVTVDGARVEGILTALGLSLTATDEGFFATPPTWRFDLQQEADLIEEVARVVGYNEIPEIDAPMPQRAATVAEGNIPVARFVLAMVDRGYHEAIHYTFTDPQLQRRLFPKHAALALANPIASDLGEMRVSLWPGLLKSLGENLRRQQERAFLFEHGAKFVLQDNELKEINCIAGVVLGAVEPEQWGTQRRAADFYDVKADVEALLALNGAADWTFERGSTDCLHPGKTAFIRRNGQIVGVLGELHPQLTRELDLPSSPVLFEVEMAALSSAHLPKAQPISRFPAVRRDIAVVVDESLTFNQLRESVTVGITDLLRELRIFDVYRGKGVEIGRKSVALGLILQDKNKTLTDADVDAVMSGVRTRLERDVKATLRD